MEARVRPQIQAPHGCEPLGALEYPIGWIEWPDYEDQRGRGQCEEVNQHLNAQLMWTKHPYRGLTWGATSMLDGKKLTFNWDEQSRG